MRREFGCLLVLGAVAMAVVRADEPTAAELAWLRAHAIPLKSVAAGSGCDDLAPFKSMVGDARIVALGEGTHGTREFFQMKHRLVEFLVSECGFTIFSIEASMPEAYRLNDYVLHGRGEPKELIAGMYFWTWNTEEVLALVEWMRAYNASGRGRIEFTGFDMQTPDVAARIVTDYLARVEPDYAAQVKGVYAAAARSQPAGAAFGVATGTFPIEAARGKRIRYSGYIKTAGVTRDFAGLWWRVDGEGGKMLGFDNMAGRGPSGTTDWQQYVIELDVPPEAVNINFGAILSGDGTAWFDDLAIELDGRPFDATSVLDPGFESGNLDGLFTAGQGYAIKVGDDHAHAGARSLRMEFGGATASGPSTSEAAKLCGEVVAHVGAARAAYVEKTAEREYEWALQNARVVQQGYQSQANEVTRDESMAANVAWILDQAPPKTRIVLWAHNGHVTTAAHPFYKPMGVHLRAKYGDELVVVGFACHSGQYTAIKRGSGLQANDLVPPGAGFAEYYFHATGLPRFALDLRAVQPADEAAHWLTQPVNFRSIGALAMDQQFMPVVLRDAFDVVIYIDETTPTRGLKS